MNIEDRVVDVSQTDNVLPFEKKIPLVSIGMPVFNGEGCIRKALDSLLAQTFTEFELIISDNSSTDGTEEICQRYSLKDGRVRYIRQTRNIGANANFELVLDEARGKYFMWAAADDVRSPDYIELNLKFLMDNSGYVASTSPVRFDGRNFDPFLMGDFSLSEDNKFARIFSFFRGWHANGRFYSLIERECLNKFPYKGCDYIGADWVWVVHLAVHGKLNRHNDGWVLLGASGVSNTSNIFAKYNDNLISFMIPFRSMFCNTIALSKGMNLSLLTRLYLKFIKLNLSALKLNFTWTLFGRRIAK